MKKLLFCLAILALSSCGLSPGPVARKIVPMEDSEACYTAILPEGPLEGYLILLPGFGESEEDVLSETELPFTLAKKGIAVFIPTLQDGPETYGFTPESQRTLALIKEDILARYKLRGMPFFVGGFSMGGSAAVRFAECSSDKPHGLFIIDSPLDMERFYYSLRRDVDVYRKGLEEGDSTYLVLLHDITDIMGGSPEECRNNYYEISPYSIGDTSMRAIRPLVDIPIRVYIEPAEGWWLDNRSTDVLGLNIQDATAFVNDLRLLGAKDVEFIPTSGRGRRRRTGTYHPHSWSIVDAEGLVEWMKEHL